MSLPSEAVAPAHRPLPVLIGALFSLLVGGLALLLAILGLLGKGSHSDLLTALPNLVTGIASVVSAIGFLRLKRWAIPVNLVAVLGHVVSHTMLYLSHTAGHNKTGGHDRLIGAQPAGMSPGQIISLAIVPVLAILVLISMEQQRRKGVLR